MLEQRGSNLRILIRSKIAIFLIKQKFCEELNAQLILYVSQIEGR